MMDESLNNEIESTVDINTVNSESKAKYDIYQEQMDIVESRVNGSLDISNFEVDEDFMKEADDE